MTGRPHLSAWLFALAASALPMLILIFGVFGIHGNAIVTASYLFLSIFAFVLSLGLPAALMQMQQEQVDHLIEERRKRKLPAPVQPEQTEN